LHSAWPKNSKKPSDFTCFDGFKSAGGFCSPAFFYPLSVTRFVSFHAEKIPSAVERGHRETMPQPSYPRHGQAWSKQEDDRLVASYLAGDLIKVMASSHQRMEGAIRSRLRKLGYLTDKTRSPTNHSESDAADKSDTQTGIEDDTPHSIDMPTQRMIDQIPSLNYEERLSLRSNCKRRLLQGNPKQKQSARLILEALENAPPVSTSPSVLKPVAAKIKKPTASSKIMPRRIAEPEFQPDLHYEALPGIAETLHAIDAGQPVILVLGRAGTGKTTLIRYLKQRPGGETQAVVAPTGVAALNAGAQTIHSFFQLPPVLLNPDQLESGRYFGQIHKKITRLVIDEISMVRVDVLDAIDARLREIKKSPRPFGGVQIVMVGDFMQLPPVVRDDDRQILDQLGYATPFAFSARVLHHVPVTRISLDHVFRQNEQAFIDILGRIRAGVDLHQTVERINQHCVCPHRDGVAPLLLTATLAAADRFNREGLAALRGEASIFTAETKGKFEGVPLPQQLELKVGARVMATRNDSERRWINGSLGTVTKIKDGEVTVRFDHTRDEHPIEQVKWEKIRQVWNEEQGKIENEVIGTYQQLPLIPAWAITIHKAQGLTLDDARIDFGTGAFAPGQVYVALSRVRSLEGLSLNRPLRVSDFHFEPMVQAFLNEQ
jgi:ATP-dependent DNA helicase PIF1